MENCPTCKSLLVFPRGHSRYCEECGWPDEDFSGVYGYPKEGERLEMYQPRLEFYDSEKERWVTSGVITATMKSWAKGKYRYKLLTTHPTTPDQEAASDE